MPIWRNTTGDGLWGTALNWLADGSGSGVPDATKDATFDALSPSCTVNALARACRNINFTGYANTITMSFGITVSGNVTLANTATYVGPSGITMNAATSTITFAGATYNLPLAISRAFNTGASTFTFADSGQVSNFNIANGGGTTTITLSGSTSTLSVSGNLITSGAGPAGASNISIVLNGSGNLSGIITTNLTFNTSGTITLTGNFSQYSTLAGGTRTILYQNGNIDWNGFSLIFYAATGATLNINFPYPIFSVQFVSGNGVLSISTLQSDLNVTNFTSLIITGASGAGNVTINGFNIYVSGNFSVPNQTCSGTTKLWITGTGTINTLFPIDSNFEINSPSGTVTLQALIFQGNRTFTYTAASTFIQTGTLEFRGLATYTFNNPGNANFGQLKFSVSTNNNVCTVNFNHDVNCTEIQFSQTGGFTINLNGNTINVSGNVTRINGPAVNGTSTIRFIGGTGTATWAGLSYGCNFLIEKSVSFTENMTFTTSGRSVIVTGTGIVNPNAASVTVSTNVSMTISNMTFWNFNLSAGVGITQNVLNTINGILQLNGNATFAGTAGWTCASLVMTAAGTFTIILQNGVTYTTTTAVQLTGATNTARYTMISDNVSFRAIWTVENTATQAISYVNGTRIDSSLGATVWTLGIVSLVAPDTRNWNNGSQPSTVGYTFVN